jgi:hypothetical protein
VPPDPLPSRLFFLLHHAFKTHRSPPPSIFHPSHAFLSPKHDVAHFFPPDHRLAIIGHQRFSSTPESHDRAAATPATVRRRPKRFCANGRTLPHTSHHPQAAGLNVVHHHPLKTTCHHQTPPPSTVSSTPPSMSRPGELPSSASCLARSRLPLVLSPNTLPWLGHYNDTASCHMVTAPAAPCAAPAGRCGWAVSGCGLSHSNEAVGQNWPTIV